MRKLKKFTLDEIEQNMQLVSDYGHRTRPRFLRLTLLQKRFEGRLHLARNWFALRTALKQQLTVYK